MKLNGDIKCFTWLGFFFKFENINKFNLIDCILSFLYYKSQYLHTVILPIKTNEIIQMRRIYRYTGLFISPSGTSELDCATTKKDTAERSISIGRESLKVFLY